MEDQLNLPQQNFYNPEPEHEQMAREQFFGKPPPVSARFYIGAVKDGEASKEAGAPVYKDTPMVLINVVGERDCMTSIVDDARKAQFPREWAYFAKAASQARPIPLESLPKMTPAVKAAFNEIGIKDVQALALADLPGYLGQWKPWALKVLNIHEYADKPKPRITLDELRTAHAI
jgi:hypothetical protein